MGAHGRIVGSVRGPRDATGGPGSGEVRGSVTGEPTGVRAGATREAVGVASGGRKEAG